MRSENATKLKNHVFSPASKRELGHVLNDLGCGLLGYRREPFP